MKSTLFGVAILLAISSFSLAQEGITIWKSESYSFPTPTLRETTAVCGEIEAQAKISAVEVTVYDSLVREEQKVATKIYHCQEDGGKTAVFSCLAPVVPGKSFITVRAKLEGGGNLQKSYAIPLSPSNAYFKSDMQELVSRSVHKDLVRSLDITKDNRYIVSGSDDKTIQVMDARTLNVVKILKGHEYYVRQVICTPDCKQIISCSDDRTIRIWDLASGREIHSFTQEAPVKLIALSRDGRYLVSAAERKPLVVWDLATREKILTFNKTTVKYHSLIFSEDGRYVISGDHTGLIAIWDVATKGAAEDMYYDREGHDKYISALALHPNMGILYSGDRLGKIKTWRMLLGYGVTDSKWASESHDMWEQRMVLVKKNTRDPLIYTPLPNATIQGYPVYAIKKSTSSWAEPFESKTERPYSEFSSEIVHLGLTGSGEYILIVTREGYIRIHDSFTSKELREIIVPYNLRSAKFSFDGSLIAVGDLNGRIIVYGLPTGNGHASKQ